MSEETRHNMMHGFMVFFTVLWISYTCIISLKAKVEASESRIAVLENIEKRE